MTTGARTYKGLAVPLLGESEIVQQVAATDILTIRQASAASGLPLVIRNSSSSNIFAVNSLGAIRTMVMGTIALASLASNASASMALVGATTADVVQFFPTVGLTTGNGVFYGSFASADKVNLYAQGGSVASQTASYLLLRTV